MSTRDEVKRLLSQGMRPADIARTLGISKPAVSKHVKALEKAKAEEKPVPPPPRPKTNASGRKGKGPTPGSFKPGNPGGPGPPRGNKNAVTTGEHETIWFDQLTEEEQGLYGRISTDGLAQLADEIKLTTIRQRRMMQRIANLAGVPFTVVERAFEQGETVEGSIDKETIKEEATLGQIQRIEEALTRVQERKAKLIELWHKLSGGDDDGAIDGLIAAIEASRRKAAENAV